MSADDKNAQILALIRGKPDHEAIALLQKLMTSAFDRGKAAAISDPVQYQRPRVPSLPFTTFEDEYKVREALREHDGEETVPVDAKAMAAVFAELTRLRGCPVDPSHPYNPVAPAPGVGLRPGFSTCNALVIARVESGATDRQRLEVAQVLLEGTPYVAVTLAEAQGRAA